MCAENYISRLDSKQSARLASSIRPFIITLFFFQCLIA